MSWAGAPPDDYDDGDTMTTKTTLTLAGTTVTLANLRLEPSPSLVALNTAIATAMRVLYRLRREYGDTRRRARAQARYARMLLQTESASLVDIFAAARAGDVTTLRAL